MARGEQLSERRGSRLRAGFRRNNERFVLDTRGEPLMPCSPRKARILLRDGKAKIAGYEPFTIRLLTATGEAVQEVHVGIDTGSKHIGVAVVSQGEVLYTAGISLRQDMKSLLRARAELRRGRRQRKTRYRPARSLNRRRKDGWLPPSLESRVLHISNGLTGSARVCLGRTRFSQSDPGMEAPCAGHGTMIYWDR